jgi:ribosome-associated protein
MKKLTTLARKKLVISALEDIKARDIQAIDVRKLTAIFDWIIVASAESARQTKSLARHVRDNLRESGSAIVGTEGEGSGEWILVDAGDVVAHVMQPAVRQYYNLEELWGEGKFEPVVNSTAPAPTPRKAPARKAQKAIVAKRKVVAKKKAVVAKKKKAPARRRKAA